MGQSSVYIMLALREREISTERLASIQRYTCIGQQIAVTKNMFLKREPLTQYLTYESNKDSLTDAFVIGF